MHAIESTRQVTLASPDFDLAVETNADTQSPISRSMVRRRVRRHWQSAIDQTLLKWLENPGAFGDIDVDPPNGTIIRLAIDYAEQFRDCLFPAPDRIVADGNGGIIFERSEGRLREVIYFWDDGAVEHQVFEDSHLIDRSLF